MTMKEVLKNCGVEDGVIDSILEAMKSGGIHTASEENLDSRYKQMKEKKTTAEAQLAEAQKLIQQLQQGQAAAEGSQSRVAELEAQVAQLEQKNRDMLVDAAMDRALSAQGAKPEDFDYLKFLWRQKGQITLDEQGQITGCKDAVDALKIQRPGQFSSTADKRYEDHRLPPQSGDAPMTREALLKKPYADRAAFQAQNPEAYRELMKK